MASYPWASSSVFEYRTPCCACPVSCFYTVSAIEDSEVNAQAYITDNVKVCTVDFGAMVSGTRTISATVTGSLIAIDGTYTDYMGYAGGAVFRFYAAAAGDVTTTFSSSGDGTLSNNATVTFYDETGATNLTDTAGVYALPQAGYYTITIAIDGNSGPPFDGDNTGTFAFDITAADMAITYCVVEVDWDDGMTTGTVQCE